MDGAEARKQKKGRMEAERNVKMKVALPVKAKDEAQKRSALIVDLIAQLYEKAEREEKEERLQLRKSLPLRSVIEVQVGRLIGLPEKNREEVIDRISELVLRLAENDEYEKEKMTRYAGENGYDEEDIHQAEQLEREFFDQKTLPPDKVMQSKNTRNTVKNKNGDEFLSVVGRSMLCGDLNRRAEEMVDWMVGEIEARHQKKSNDGNIFSDFLKHFAPALAPHGTIKDRDYDMTLEIGLALKNINNPKGQIYPLIRSVEMVLNDILDATAGTKVEREYFY